VGVQPDRLNRPIRCREAARVDRIGLFRLYAWDIAPDGRVTERGPLAGEPEPRVERRRAE